MQFETNGSKNQPRAILWPLICMPDGHIAHNFVATTYTLIILNYKTFELFYILHERTEDLAPAKDQVEHISLIYEKKALVLLF